MFRFYRLLWPTALMLPTPPPTPPFLREFNIFLLSHLHTDLEIYQRAAEELRKDFKLLYTSHKGARQQYNGVYTCERKTMMGLMLPGRLC